MKDINKLREIIREEIKNQIKLQEAETVASSAFQGGIIGYLAGVLADFFLKRKKTTSAPEKSYDELQRELQKKLDDRYKTDPKFREIVDNIMSGKKYRF